ncbi:family 4 carbohydrate esterase [Moniliophthora roreri MCA 2997]|uniref:Family 4 carbohydrate esterase n=1 Tax=Moniliophthora roreri (strain MCA 2997) TaxID=1381753 RepID=V2WEW4_MONRO|nr:family 4 carbohydrate esterase [Moniliophthora roreri MCA 2997]
MMKLTAGSTTLTARSLHEERHALTLATVFMTCKKTPNTVAFAFDDVPWIYNDEIVAFLANQSIKATFFLQRRELLLRSELYKDLPYQNRVPFEQTDEVIARLSKLFGSDGICRAGIILVPRVTTQFLSP